MTDSQHTIGADRPLVVNPGETVRGEAMGLQNGGGPVPREATRANWSKWLKERTAERDGALARLKAANAAIAAVRGVPASLPELRKALDIVGLCIDPGRELEETELERAEGTWISSPAIAVHALAKLVLGPMAPRRTRLAELLPVVRKMVEGRIELELEHDELRDAAAYTVKELNRRYKDPAVPLDDQNMIRAVVGLEGALFPGRNRLLFFKFREVQGQKATLDVWDRLRAVRRLIDELGRAEGGAEVKDQREIRRSRPFVKVDLAMVVSAIATVVDPKTDFADLRKGGRKCVGRF